MGYNPWGLKESDTAEQLSTDISETLLEKGPVLYVGSENFVEHTALPWQDSLGSSGP